MELGPSDVFLQKAPVSFDASVQELFNSLACNGKLLLAAPGRREGHAVPGAACARRSVSRAAALCRRSWTSSCRHVQTALDVYA